MPDHRRRTLTLFAGLLAAAACVVAACGDDESAGDADVVAHYADGVHASYSASLESATAMDEAIDAFIAQPTPDSLEAAKAAWLEARDDYGLTEVFRFYGGPIDNEETGKEGEINAWPLDEAYVDYVQGDAEAGIVNDPQAVPEITPESIAALNEQGGETNISTGWHAIEFLLWGQDLSADGPGTREATDYTTAAGAERRAAYLEAASDLLIADLRELVDAWAPDQEGNYRADFVAKPTEEALRDMFVGMGELSRGELAGERMNVAYSERSEEDEHSCFSDNTVSDFVANAKGIQMVYTGEYPGAEGPGLSELVSEADAGLDEQLAGQLEQSVALAGAIPAPFDRLVAEGVPDTDPGRVAVLNTITALEDQSDTIVDAAAALDVTVNLS
jgi:putative iron-regulated protein